MFLNTRLLADIIATLLDHDAAPSGAQAAGWRTP
jgi:hypothetical protein